MARSTARGSGNYPRDEAWLEWMEQNGGLEVVSPEADDIPFPAKVRWSGLKADEGSPWQVPPAGENRCVGKAYLRDADGDYIVDAKNERLQRPCWNWAMKGTTVCIKHGGGIGRVRRSATERMASALDAVTGQLVMLALECKDEKVRLGAITALMDRVGVRPGVDMHEVRDPAYLDVLKDVFEKAGVTPSVGD